MADHFDEELSDWTNDATLQWILDHEYEQEQLAEATHEMHASALDQLLREQDMEQTLKASLDESMQLQILLEDMRERNDWDSLFALDQMELLHHLPVPDPVPDATYRELEKASSSQLLRQIKQEERHVWTPSGRGPAARSGPLARFRRLVGCRRGAQQSPLLQQAADTLCAHSDSIRQYVNVGTAVSVCAFLLPTLAGTSTALILTVSMLVAKMGVVRFCADWRSK